jgi:NADH-quinone oxidoreductase subunit L
MTEHVGHSVIDSLITLPQGMLEAVGQIDERICLLPLLPLLGSVVSYVVGGGPKIEDDHHEDHDHSHDDHASHGHESVSGMSLSSIVATGISFFAFVISVLLFNSVLSNNTLTQTLWTWISVPGLEVPFAFRFDHLSGMMCLVITGIGTLIHLYASGYMSHDPHQPRFFAYLNLFLASMLILVLGDNLLLTFVGWEGVGLCSYLLIGFWFKEMPNAVAGQKAFIVNRIGDAGFLLGMFVLYIFVGSLSPEKILSSVDSIPPYAIEVACMLLLVGALGKSAQIPLYVWLPDAMAGPTPVSALIHAATMVTSGIYMITRLSGLYSLAPITLTVISVIGTLTAFVAATIALVQFDIKKVLAYSTVSQLGFMFMALGAGAYSVGMYHVVTHAFFKALLFMAAGSVIVGCHHEQDMRNFGGLSKYMKGTFLTYFAGTYAIAGLPYGSGFFSKDSVLWAVYSNPGLPSTIMVYGDTSLSHVLWMVGILTALLTAFYMTRSLMLTFFGEYRGHAHPHESPFNMVFPLVVLSVPSLAFSYFYGDALLDFLKSWTRSDFIGGHHVLLENHTYHQLEEISKYVALGSAVSAVLIYSSIKFLPGLVSKTFAPVYNFLQGKWFVDEIYNLIIVTPLAFLSKLLFILVDRLTIDSLFVNGSGVMVDTAGMSLKKIHRGGITGMLGIMFSVFIVILLFWIIL